MISAVILLLECFALWTLNSFGVEERPLAMVLPMILVFSFGYFVDISRNKYTRSIQLPLILGFLFRIALLVFDVYGRGIYVLPNSGADADMFYRLGVLTANGYPNNRGFFIDVIGFIFHGIGVSRLFVQFLLMLCSVVALHFGNRIIVECEVEEDTRFKVMLLLCLLPNFAILSSIFLRESLITMLVTISLYHYVCWINKKKESRFIFALVFVFLSMMFHSGMIGIAVAYLLSRLFYNKKNGHLSFTLGNLLASTIILLLAVFVLNRYGNRFLGKFRNVDSIEDLATVGTIARSSYTQYVGNSNNIANMVIYTIPRLVFFLFSPMPFQWRGISDIIAFVFSALFYIVVIWRTLSFLLKPRSESKKLVLMLFMAALVTTFIFAWGTSNSGTAVRHRDKLFILYGVILSLTLCTEKKCSKE